ncbi:hypothetical protein CLOM_g5988 [Closterium sp. NIES-68]|nr:hypothetical protein CLOM_g5988 [Closterium sp. NIES-68]GJP80051.1 hypothetical protein CLOP_g10287 [Closterium sp. NIES-67]
MSMASTSQRRRSVQLVRHTTSLLVSRTRADPANQLRPCGSFLLAREPSPSPWFLTAAISRVFLTPRLRQLHSANWPSSHSTSAIPRNAHATWQCPIRPSSSMPVAPISTSRPLAAAVTPEPASSYPPSSSSFKPMESPSSPPDAPLPSRAHLASLSSPSLVDALCAAVASAGRARGQGGGRALCARVLRAAALAGNADVVHRVMHALVSAGVPVMVGAQISFLRALCNAGSMHQALDWLENQVHVQQQSSSSRRRVTAGRRGQMDHAQQHQHQHQHQHHRSAAASPSPVPLSASANSAAAAAAAAAAVCAPLCAAVFNVVLTACAQHRDSRSAARCVLLMERCAVPCDAISYTELIKLAGLVGDRQAVLDLWEQLLHAMASPHTHPPHSHPPHSPPAHSPTLSPTQSSSRPTPSLSPHPSTTTSFSPSASSSTLPPDPTPSPLPSPPPLPLVALSARVIAFSRIPGALSDALQAMGDMEAAVLRELEAGGGRIGSGRGLLLERTGGGRWRGAGAGAGDREGIVGVDGKAGVGVSATAAGAAGPGAAGAAAAARVSEEVLGEGSSSRREGGMSEARGTWGCSRQGSWDGQQLLALIAQNDGRAGDDGDGEGDEDDGEEQQRAEDHGSGNHGALVEEDADVLLRDMRLGLELQGERERRAWEAVEMGLRVGWNAIVNAAAKQGRWDVALAMLQRMLRWGVHPDDYTVNALIRAAFASDRPTVAQALFDLLSSATVNRNASAPVTTSPAGPLTPSSHSSSSAESLRVAVDSFLTYGLIRSGNTQDALQLFHQIRHTGASSSSSAAAGAGAVGAARAADGDAYDENDDYDDDGSVAALEVATASMRSGGDHSTHLRFTGNALIRACSKQGRFEDAFQVFQAMLADKLPVDTCTLQALLLLAAGPSTPTRWGIRGSAGGGRGDSEKGIIGGWDGRGEEDMARHGTGVGGGRELGEMEWGGGGERGGRGGNRGEVEAGTGYGRWQNDEHDEDTDRAAGDREDLGDEPGMAMGVPVGAGMGEEGEEEEGGTRQREVWRRVAAVEAAMAAAGIRHSAASFNTLVRVLGEAGLCSAMQRHVQWGLSTPDAAGRPLTDTLTLNTAIAAAARLGQVHAARQLFRVMEQHPHLTPTTVTFNALLNALAVAARDRGVGGASGKGRRRGGEVLVEPEGQWRGRGELEGEGGGREYVSEVCEVIREMEERGIEADTVTFNTAIKAACNARDYTAAHGFLECLESHQRLAPDETSYSTAIAYAAFQGNIWHMELFLARLLRQRVPISFSALASVVEAYASAVPRRLDEVTAATLALAEHSQQVEVERGDRGKRGHKAREGAELAEDGGRREVAVVAGGVGEGGGVVVRSEEGRLMEFAWQLAADVESSIAEGEEGGGRRESVVGWRVRIEEQLQKWDCSS